MDNGNRTPKIKALFVLI